MLGIVGCVIGNQAEVNGGQFALYKFRDSRAHVLLFHSYYTFKNRRRLARKFGLCKLYDHSPEIPGKPLPEVARHSLVFLLTPKRRFTDRMRQIGRLFFRFCYSVVFLRLNNSSL